MSHFEVSPREREDEARRHERDFDVRELADEDLQDTILRMGDTGDGEPE